MRPTWLDVVAVAVGLASACTSSPGRGIDAASPDASLDLALDSGRDGAPRDLALPGDAGLSSTRQTPRPLGASGAPNGFYEYLPPNYGDGVPRPLLVFWHGIGEDGNGTTDLARVVANGPPMLIARNRWPADRPFIVLSPQHGPSGCPGSGELHAFITWAMGHYTVDPKRVYLTGLSCGAIGSWDYLGTYRATQIAAAVLIAGDPGPPAQSYSAWGRSGCMLGNASIWAFHGDQDGTVNIANEKATMMNLLACSARRDARFNVIAGGGHAIWGPIYDLSAGFDIYNWLLTNAKP